MKISPEQLTKNIAVEVAKLLLPRIKKQIAESILQLKKDMIYEQHLAAKKVVTRKPTRVVVEEEYDDEKEVDEIVNKRIPNKDSVAEAKKIMAKRAIENSREKARKELEKQYISEDVLGLINDTELQTADPSLQPKLDRRTIAEAGTINASSLGKDDIVDDPSQIYYGDLISDLTDK